ncbi:integrase [Gossypium australe]|uniref:Integrase n=1 Tax=Gossypium australe TaxID=47621 RepID=A0A5B6VXG5_9ROSI|nr:integrase [Gossypium australe]
MIHLTKFGITTCMIELLKDYDCVIEYHPRKAVVVADALILKSLVDLKSMFARLFVSEDGGLLVELQVRPVLSQNIRERQPFDESLARRIRQVESCVRGDYDFNSDGVLCFRGRLYVPGDEDLRHTIFTEAHSSLFIMHPDGNKIYHDLRKDVVDFVARCLVCQRVKTEHQRPSEWKKERITMDFVSGLPLTPTQFLFRSYQTEIRGLLRDSRRHCMRLWVQSFILVQLIIHNSMVN